MGKGNRYPNFPSSSLDSTEEEEEEICLYTKIITTVPLKVKRHETISNFKALLRAKVGISENLQELFFAGNRLMNDQRLVDYGIQQDSMVNLVLQNVFGVRLYVNTPSYQKIIAIEARPFDTIQNIKSIIEAKEGIQSNQYTLIHNGKVLDDERILSSLNIPNEATFDLVFNPKDVIPIFVRRMTGEILKFDVKVLFTIRDVKAIVRSMTGVPNIDWDLIYAGKKLEDWKTLASYDLKEENILEMFPASFPIFVTTQGGKTITLDVQRCNTIKDVKDKIFHNLAGVLDDDWDLIHAGEQLEDWRTLASYEIRKETVLEMSRASFPIFVKQWNGKTINFTVGRYFTIKEVKYVLSWRLGIPVYYQSILFNGKRLEDERDLGSYGVQMDSTLHMVLWHNVAIIQIAKIGKTIPNCTTIEVLKTMIKEKMQRTPKDIYFDGVALQNDHSLTDYKIDMNSTVTVTF